jgi:predicted RNA binding protein YcfA (HicA-like mRNA interferase family)
MARKVRELMRQLERAGFVNRGGRGSHRNYQHPNGPRVTISGNEGDDAKPYQERAVSKAIAESETTTEGEDQP